MSQLIIPYQKNTKQTFDSYYSNDPSNENIIECIKSIFASKNSQIFIWGENCSGKSHILYSTCNYFSKDDKKCVYLPLKDYKSFNEDIISSFDEYDLICIDDIDYIFGLKEWEYSFFNLVNRVINKSKKIIYTSSSSPNSKNIKLLDLQSRLSWGLVFKINNADDFIKEKILKKIIIEKEYNISLKICSYLLKREERSMLPLIDIIHKVGHHSFATNKKVNIKDLRAILD